MGGDPMADPTPRRAPSADEIAEMASRGEDVSAYFTNKFTVAGDVSPGLDGRNPLACQPYAGHADIEMQLDSREANLAEAFRRLPPEAAAELSALAKRLAARAPHHRIDWSDAWSDEDLRDFRAASLRRLEAEESEKSR
jgi:hypothetical protein